MSIKQKKDLCILCGVRTIKICDRCYDLLKTQIKLIPMKEITFNLKKSAEFNEIFVFNLTKIMNKNLQIFHFSLERECFTGSSTLKSYFLKPYIAELNDCINESNRSSPNLGKIIKTVKKDIIKPIIDYSKFYNFSNDLKPYFTMMKSSILQIECLLNYFN
ncbi:MAG: hypothetical protein ACW98A_03870 [Candidatus Hodarchaeales archaeon]|jgi:hypothetical protein